MAAFPPICPSQRVYQAAAWPVRSAESLSGITSRRLFGDSPSSATLSLTFENIADADAVLIEQSHRDSRGDTDAVTLPAEAFGGMGAGLAGAVAAPGAGLAWHWDGPPEITSILPGVSTVRCQFRATQDG